MAVSYSKVSVVMATYNGELFIHEQLDSILNQTYPIHEIIISDDCSSDRTWDIISEYANRFPNIVKAYRNIENIGPHSNFKRAFTYANGNFIAPSDQDDIWSTNKIEILLDAIGTNYELVYAQDCIIWEDGHISDYITYIPNIDKLIWGNTLKGHTCLFRNELVPLFQKSGSLSYDYALAIYCCVRNTALGLPNILTYWKRHNTSVTQCITSSANGPSKKNKWLKMFATMICLMKGWKNNNSIGISSSFKSRSEFLKYVLSRINVNSFISINEIRLYIEILNKISKQSYLSILKAALLNVKVNQMSHRYKKMILVDKIRSVFWAFRLPYIFWYDYHNEDYLG